MAHPVNKNLQSENYNIAGAAYLTFLPVSAILIMKYRERK